MALHWAAVMLAFLAGTGLQLQQASLHAGAWRWMALLAGLAGVGAWLARWRRSQGASQRPLPPRGPDHMPVWTWGVTALCLAALAAGAALAQWRGERLTVQQWPAAWGDGQAFTWRLTARVLDMPDLRAGGMGLRLAVETVQPVAPENGRPAAQGPWRGGEPWQRADLPQAARVPERVGLFWLAPPEAKAPEPGEVWQWVVTLDPTDARANPGGPDLPLLAWERGERGQVRWVKGTPAVRVQPAHWRSGGAIERWRSRLRALVLAHTCPPGQALPADGYSCLSLGVAGLVRGLALGEQGAINPDDWDNLRLTGTAHLAAISGLHVAMLGWLCARLLGLCWRRSRRAMARHPAPQVERLAMVLGALGYALLSGWGVPAQRTVWMVGLVAGLQASGHRWPWPLVCLLAAVGVIAWDPWALLSAGFWLSFVAVAVLMFSGDDDPARPGAQRDAPNPSAVHAAATEPTQPDGLGQRLLNIWRQAYQAAAPQVRGLWRTQWVATVGLAPLSLVFFQATSLVSLATNLGAIPWFSLALTPLALLGLFMEPAWWLMQVLGQHTLQALAAVARHSAGWAWWVVPEVQGWAAALGVLGGAWCVAPVPTRTRLLALPLCLPLLCPTSLSQRWPAPAQGAFEVWAADVGQGTAVLVRTAGHTLLFDTGPTRFGGGDAGRDTLDGLLRAVGAGGLDELLISHADTDHIGGAVSLMTRWPVGRLRASLAPDHALWAQPDVSGAVPPGVACQAGQRWHWDGVSFEVLHPFTAVQPHDARPDNAASCVLAVRTMPTTGQKEQPGQPIRQVLLTGDIEADQEAALAESMPRGLRSEVLLVAHHGSRTSSTEALLQAVQPQWAVVQVGARNRYGHPNPGVLQRLQAHGAQVVTTPACGAWHWHSAQAAPPTCWKTVRRRHWHAPAASPSLHSEGS